MIQFLYECKPTISTHMPVNDRFSAIEQLVNERFQDAVVADNIDERYNYFLLGSREGVALPVGSICIANTVEPLSLRNKEELRIAVPVVRADAVMPVSALGSQAHYFYLTYVRKWGELQTIRVDATAYDAQFTRRRKPPVSDLLQKLGSYGVVPMRRRVRDDQDVFRAGE